MTGSCANQAPYSSNPPQKIKKNTYMYTYVYMYVLRTCIIPTLDIQCQVGPQQIITTTTTHGCGGHKAAAWREVLLKVEKKSGQIRSGATGTVPSALRSRGQCALESPRSLLRVARTCPQSAARTTGRAAIDRVVERMNGREADGLQSYLLKSRKFKP